VSFSMDFLAKINAADFFKSSKEILKEAGRIRDAMNEASKSFMTQSESQRITENFKKLGTQIDENVAKRMQSAFEKVTAGVNAANLAQTKLAAGIGKASDNAKESAKWMGFAKAASKDMVDNFASLNTEGQMLTASMVQTVLEISRFNGGLKQAEGTAGRIAAKFLALQGIGDAAAKIFSTGAIGAAGNAVMSSIGDEMSLTSQIGRGGIATLLNGAYDINQNQPWLKNRYNVNGGLSLGNMLLQQHASLDTIMKSANAGGLGVQAGISTESEMAQLMMSIAGYDANLTAGDRMTLLAQIQAASKAGGATTGATTTALTSFLNANTGFMTGMGAASGAASLMAAASGTGAGPQFANLISNLLTEGRKNPEGPQAKALQILFGSSMGDIDKRVRSGNYGGLRLNANFLNEAVGSGAGAVELQARLKALGLSDNIISASAATFNTNQASTENLRVSPGDAQQQLLNSLENSRGWFDNLAKSTESLVTQQKWLRDAFYSIYGVLGSIAGLATSIAGVAQLFVGFKTLSKLNALEKAAGPAAEIAAASAGGGLWRMAGTAGLFGAAAWAGNEIGSAITGTTLSNEVPGLFGDLSYIGQQTDVTARLTAKKFASDHAIAESLRMQHPAFAGHDDAWLLAREKEFRSGALSDDPSKNISGITRSAWSVRTKLTPEQQMAVRNIYNTGVGDRLANYGHDTVVSVGAGH
jgi:hypothetical protein